MTEYRTQSRRDAKAQSGDRKSDPLRLRASASTPLIQVRGLTRRFGRVYALKGVDLDVAAGERVVIFGPNGAGKTTFLQIMATLLRPTSGRVLLAGHDLARAADSARRHIGFVTHRPLLYGALTARENLLFYGGLYSVPDASARADELLHMVGLYRRRNDLVRTFSRGMVQRLAISRALMHDPAILLLDEPDTGLDPQAADELFPMLWESGGGRRTVVMTTHHLDLGLAWAHRFAILYGGRIVHGGETAGISLDELRSIYREQTGGEA